MDRQEIRKHVLEMLENPNPNAYGIPKDPYIKRFYLIAYAELYDKIKKNQKDLQQLGEQRKNIDVGRNEFKERHKELKRELKKDDCKSDAIRQIVLEGINDHRETIREWNPEWERNREIAEELNENLQNQINDLVDLAEFLLFRGYLEEADLTERIRYVW